MTCPPDKVSQDAHSEAPGARAHDRSGLMILGMHRSGTSCLAGMLQCAGFFAGKVTRWDSHNRKGNREDPRVNNLNELVLQMSGGSWSDPPARIHWTAQAAEERDELLQEFMAAGAPWMFKDPRTLLTLPFWREGGTMQQRLGVWRNPIAVAQSLAVRNALPMARGVELWLAYNEALLREYRHAPFPVVCFDAPRAEFLAAVTGALRTLYGDSDVIRSLRLERLGEFFDEELINQSAAGAPLERALRAIPDLEGAVAARVVAVNEALRAASGHQAAEAPGVHRGSESLLAGLVSIEQAQARGDLGAAWQSCNALVESAPQRADLWLRLIGIAKTAGDKDRLAHSIDRALAALPQDASVTFEGAKLHWVNGAHAEAFAAAERAAALAPDWSEPRLRLGAWAVARKRWDDARKWLAPLAADGQGGSRGGMLLGIALIHLGEPVAGDSLVTAAIQNMDRAQQADTLRRWGFALQSVGRPQEAEEKLAGSLALDPALPGVAAALAGLQLESGDPAAALETVERTVSAGGDSAALRLAAARIRQSLGEEPDQDIAAGLALHPGHRALSNLAGQRAYAKGEFALALEHFRAADSLIGAARCHFKLGNTASAVALLDEILSRTPDHAQARRMRDALAR